MQPEEYRRTSYEAWGSVAPGWDRWQARIEESTAPVQDWIVRELAPQPGDTVLELAAGPGGTGFAAAACIGASGRLIMTDFSPDMIEIARRRGSKLGLRNVAYRVMDAERIELDSASVDGVLCRFGYMLMADPAAALAETRRVLRPGGRLALAVWGPPERNPWIAIGARLLVENGRMPPPEPGAPGPFSMASEERTQALLQGAGFTQTRLEDVPVRFAYRDLDDFIDFGADTGGPFAAAIRSMSQDEREAMKQQLTRAFAGFASAAGYEFPGAALCAVAS